MRAAVTIALLAALAPAAATAQDSDDDATQPQGHFRVERPAELSDAEASTIYDRIRAASVAGYRLSGDRFAAAYVSWRRFNEAPYRSATHGRRFVNNYANEIAAAYGKHEDAGTLPVGSVLAKDSFAVTARGDVFTGPLFLMEKMPAGFDPEALDWRYSMIMPDGSLFGVTKGPDSGKVAFCVACHKEAGSRRDHLFFVPEKYRRPPLGREGG